LDYRVALDGVLAARHFPGLIKTGDCLAVIATLTDGP
jgi:N-alpha-acetyl-L-2,4-diaminobutyrate deacetylase